MSKKRQKARRAGCGCIVARFALACSSALHGLPVCRGMVASRLRRLFGGRVRSIQVELGNFQTELDLGAR